MEVELLRAIPGGGAVVGVIVLVILFLRHIKEMHESYGSKIESSMATMADKFNSEHSATRQAFQSQIEKLTDQVLDVSRETSTAVKGLEDAVRDLQTKIK